jgi:uncharacterized membrane protein YfcA
MEHYELLLFFLVIAAVYASVGFGGGSSYLAIMTLYQFPFSEMKLTALACNIIVVTGGTIIFARSGQVPWRKAIPLLVASVPLAFLGARMKLSQNTFFIILGCSLIAAAILLWLKTRKATDFEPQPMSDSVGLVIGASIGLLSGMVGIGGGIFLAPLLHLLRWDTPKKIAATASLFILVNSVSGIAGQLTALQTEVNYTRIALLCGAVLIGGQVGSRLGAAKFNMLIIRRITAILVFAAGAEVLCKHLPWFK